MRVFAAQSSEMVYHGRDPHELRGSEILLTVSLLQSMKDFVVQVRRLVEEEPPPDEFMRRLAGLMRLPEDSDAVRQIANQVMGAGSPNRTPPA